MTQHERALQKIQAEIQKDIQRAIQIAKECGLLELMYLLYNLHWTRLLDQFPNAQYVKEDVVKTYSNMLEESYKYQISLVAKFGHWGFRKTKEGQLFLNISLLQFFTKHCNYINSKYETETFIQLFDIEVFGERDRYIKIDMMSVNENPKVKTIFDYFLRIDIDNTIRKNSKKTKADLINSFKNEYLPSNDIFVKEFDISVEEYCFLIETILNKITDAIEARKDKYVLLENGNVDVLSYQTFMNFSMCFMHDKTKLYSEFDSKFHKALDRLMFDASKFDETQLRFHHVTRQPILVTKSILLISPELILDSLFTNIHYSMIESEELKHDYVARQASAFLDKIVLVASKFGYTEVGREKDLYEGKNQIGDIDLILKNDKDEYLLIEAKNHALPMDVYFKDIAKTQDHLVYLQNHWEKKVKKRVSHLQTEYAKYGLHKDHKYIVVSRFPEIISHHSDLLVLSLNEFEEWLSKYINVTNFSEFYKLYYDDREKKYTIEDLKQMSEDGLSVLKFEEPEIDDSQPPT